jgi:hypothetical protein
VLSSDITQQILPGQEHVVRRACAPLALCLSQKHPRRGGPNLRVPTSAGIPVSTANPRSVQSEGTKFGTVRFLLREASTLRVPRRRRHLSQKVWARGGILGQIAGRGHRSRARAYDSRGCANGTTAYEEARLTVPIRRPAGPPEAYLRQGLCQQVVSWRNIIKPFNPSPLPDPSHLCAIVYPKSCKSCFVPPGRHSVVATNCLQFTLSVNCIRMMQSSSCCIRF